MALYFYAISKAPLVEVTTLIFITPCFVSILSVLFLGDHFNSSTLLPLGLGFAGILFILAPGFKSITGGHYAAVGSSLFAAVMIIQTKLLSEHKTVDHLVSKHLVLMSIIVLPFSMAEIPALRDIPVMALSIGLLGFSAQYFLTRAVSLGKLNEILPLDYSRLLWITVFSYFLYDEMIGPRVVMGAILIIISSGYITLLQAPSTTSSRR
jgi:S-adenosylmethionine uptake transporter